MTGPATAVKTAVAAGASNVDAITRLTGLPRGMVEAITEQLQRVGELTVDRIGFGCPDGACGTCSSGNECDSSRGGGTHGGAGDGPTVALGPTRRRNPSP